MERRERTIRSRELGDGLRQAMQDAGLTGKQAAQMLGVSPRFVSNAAVGKTWSQRTEHRQESSYSACVEVGWRKSGCSSRDPEGRPWCRTTHPAVTAHHAGHSCPLQR